MNQLSIEDYKKLLKYSYQINEDYETFPHRVIGRLKDIFSIENSVYTIYDCFDDGRIEPKVVISNFMPQKLILNYKTELYNEDPLFYDKNELVSEELDIPLLMLSEEGYNDWKKTDFGKQLHKLGMANICILGGVVIKSAHKTQLHRLHIYKPIGNPDFTDYEIELYHQINEIFSRSVTSYKQHLKPLREVGGLLSEFDKREIGISILGDEDLMFCTNELFMNYSSNISKFTDPLDIATTFINEAHSKMPDSKGTVFSKSFIDHDFLITVNSNHIFCVNGSVQPVTCITIEKSKAQISENIESTLLNHYNLTKRETEIAGHILEEKSNHEISSELYISLATVKSHVRNIFAKVEVNSRSEFKKLIEK